MCVPASFVKSHLCVLVKIYFWILYSVLLVHVSLFLLISWCFGFHFGICFESGTIMFLVQFQDCFEYLGSSVVPHTLVFFFFLFCEEYHQYFIGIALNLQISLSNVDVLAILTLMVHEHGLYFHFLVSSSISLSSLL